MKSMVYIFPSHHNGFNFWMTLQLKLQENLLLVQHQTNLIYAFKEDNITRYVGQTNVRFGTRVDQHSNTDKLSSVYKYKQERGIDIGPDNFEILDKGYSRTLNRRIAEAMFIKEHKEPELNKQKKTAKLLLFD